MTLELLVDGAAGDGFVEVHLVAVEIGAVHAGKLGFAANGQTAAAAHTGAVNHDGAHGNGAGQVVLLGGHGDELHHDQGANGDDFVIGVAFCNQSVQSIGDQTLYTSFGGDQYNDLQ